MITSQSDANDLPAQAPTPVAHADGLSSVRVSGPQMDISGLTDLKLGISACNALSLYALEGKPTLNFGAHLPQGNYASRMFGITPAPLGISACEAWLSAINSAISATPTIYLDHFSPKELEELSQIVTTPDRVSIYASAFSALSPEKVNDLMSDFLRVQKIDWITVTTAEEDNSFLNSLKLSFAADTTKQALSEISVFQPTLTGSRVRLCDSPEDNFNAINISYELRQFALRAKNGRISANEFVNEYVGEIPEFRIIAELAQGLCQEPQEILEIHKKIRRFLARLTRGIVRSAKRICCSIRSVNIEANNKQKLWPLLMAFKNN